MIVVAGHLCLDMIPALASGTELRPGLLIEAGPAQISTGGAVSNVGVSLKQLGADVRLVGKVGDDPFGKMVLDVLRGYGCEKDIIVDPNGDTSYTIVINTSGRDRSFLHCPGCNETFVSADVSDEMLKSAKHLHLGYPPLLAAMSADNGQELVDLFTRAKGFGLTTSLDMSLPDPASKQGQVDWAAVLIRVLPLVDYFLPSEDELAFMLPKINREIPALAAVCFDLGAKSVIIKRGHLGLYGIQGSKVGYWQECFPAEVVGTTGAGDATIAGFLYGVSQGFSFEKCLAAGCAVGAFCVQVADAVSGIRPWSEVQERYKV